MIRVGVLRGGSHNFNKSIEDGGVIISHLLSDNLRDGYQPVDVFVDENNIWHIGGVPAKMDKVRDSVDVIFNVLQGVLHDGEIKQHLDYWGIPYVGSGPQSSMTAHNRELAKIEFDKLGVKTPRHIVYPPYREEVDGDADKYPVRKAREVLSLLPPYWTIKPLTRGSSMGIHVCKTLPDLALAFAVSMNEGVSVMVEELIEGKPTTISVLDDFRGQHPYPMICLGNFTSEEKKSVEELATLIHKGLDFRHFSQTDFIITPKRGIYAIESRTIPDIKESSTLRSHLEAIGLSVSDFLKHLVKTALIK